MTREQLLKKNIRFWKSELKLDLQPETRKIFEEKISVAKRKLTRLAEVKKELANDNQTV